MGPAWAHKNFAKVAGAGVGNCMTDVEAVVSLRKKTDVGSAGVSEVGEILPCCHAGS